MSKSDRAKPQFLEDTPNLADFIAERLKDIRKLEGRVAQEPGFVTQPATESYGGFYDPAYAAPPQQAITGPFGWWPSIKAPEPEPAPPGADILSSFLHYNGSWRD